MDIDEKPLGVILNMVCLVYTIEHQVKYFELNIKSAQIALEKMGNDQEIIDYLLPLYQVRRRNLEKFIWHSIKHLNEQ